MLIPAISDTASGRAAYLARQRASGHDYWQFATSIPRPASHRLHSGVFTARFAVAGRWIIVAILASGLSLSCANDAYSAEPDFDRAMLRQGCRDDAARAASYKATPPYQ